ncbi:MAG: sigma factor-like helix-turn-helix DNA-binding protein, partial [Bacillota bacterium]|nr:sigma factor-like helix-turn-helix DNA-binding protein [Bacillota bacterium]
MKIEDITRTSLLCDFYGELLTERQRQITELYVQENLTLGEIAGELGISRQAVHDALCGGQRSLESY